jgi:hypothetical protein
MNTSRTFFLAAGALVVGFFAARWCAAQPPPQKQTTYDFGALEQLASFVSYLQDTKQTNTIQRFNSYSNASLASRHYADLGVTLNILQRLRDGRTNQAYELLEGQLDVAIIGFVTSYHELPVAARQQPEQLKMLQQARDYRARFPFKHRYASVDDAVAGAFTVLHEKITK